MQAGNTIKGRLLQFVKPSGKTLYTCLNLIGTKYLTRLKLGFSHLCYRKFKLGFPDTIDPFCICSTAIKNTIYYFLRYPNFSRARKTLLGLTDELLNKAY